MLASTAGAVRWLPSTAVACCSTLFGYAVMLGVGCDAGLVDSISLFTYRLDPRIGPLHRETAWLGVGLRADCLTHVLPRCLPTPTEEADGNGYGVITGRGGPSRQPPRVSVNLVPLLLTGVRLHPPGWTDKNLCRCFGAPACRVFPDHLITCWKTVRSTHMSMYNRTLARETLLPQVCTRLLPKLLLRASRKHLL